MRIGAKLGCHQKPDRSFFIHGYQFPVCARCTGIILGYLIGAIMTLILHVSIQWDVGIIMCIPLAFDGGTQYLRWRESTQILRLLTGILAGVGTIAIQSGCVEKMMGVIM